MAGESEMEISPGYDDVVAAAARIEGVANRTPVFTSRTLDALTGARIFFKMENLQRVGAFKFRGAYNAIAALPPAERKRGVLAYSSGNHAQAVALAASLLGIEATIVMPTDAPATKLAATRGYGAKVVSYDRHRESREEIAATLSRELGLAVVPPFDHLLVIAGQGTAAKELFEEVGTLDALYVPVGGGGLLSGSALSARALAPGCKVIGVEPQAGDDGVQALQAGKIVKIPTPNTIADGAQTQALGRLTFGIIQRHVDALVTVDDDALRRQMQVFMSTMKTVVEPTGCLGAAAAIARAGPGARVGVIVSGGNVDAAAFCRHIDGLEPAAT